ncbi:glycosyltransferase [Sporolactobacillus kofuensis]|uniref:Glycosyltransferase n=1 Tax=Sporolactobacillus kofuensis TaxID=269672 RepID=A0ABW1WCU6_9BACL|nr:glycosyltransferase [Sporolactobacillus kofuensis]MCO7177114.1 glycosyltransferase [Sporolactobacillus kofuensis]
MNEKKVSIIIPVYNCEKYLDQCLMSVVNQTMDSIEIVLVNDGSTDNSQAVIDKFASKYDCITSLAQKNSGQGMARNRALDIVTGEYVMFLDGDDYIETDTVKYLYELAKKDQLDIVVYNWKKVDRSGRPLESTDHADFDEKNMDSQELIYQFLTNNQQLIEGFSWNKFIRREIFETNHIRFPLMKFEDIPTMFNVLSYVQRGKYINKNIYNYVSHNASTVHSMGKQSLEDFLSSINMVGDILDTREMKAKFENDYFVYKANQLLREFGRSFNTISASTYLTERYKQNLDQLTIGKWMKSSHYSDYKLIIKMLCYKLGLLQLLIKAYHKIKPIN